MTTRILPKYACLWVYPSIQVCLLCTNLRLYESLLIRISAYMNLRLYESLLHQKIVDERRANFDVESSKMGQTYEG
jgi:hypothetical protein